MGSLNCFLSPDFCCSVLFDKDSGIVAFIQKIVAEDVVTKSTSSYAYFFKDFSLPHFIFQLIFHVHIHFPQNIYNFIMILMLSLIHI